MSQIARNEQPTFTDQVRQRFQDRLDPIAAFLDRIGIYPNTVTLVGLVGNTIGAYFLSQGRMTIGGLLILSMGPVDALDGTMARIRGEPTAYGAFVDSVTDRYSELVIYGGLLVHFLLQGEWFAIGLTYAAAAGSILVSYTRARAQSLGYEAKVGTFTRFERYLVLAPALVINQPLLGIAILAIGSNWTALQRILHVRRQARS